MTHIWVI